MVKDEVRHKVVVIPVSFLSDKPKFLTVKDSKSKEWTFITGGCKKKEIPNTLSCALRELEEETRGAVNLKKGKFKSFTFSSKSRSKEELDKDNREGIQVSTLHHVYIFELNKTPAEQNRIKSQFSKHKEMVIQRKKNDQTVKKMYDENDELEFETLEEFNRHPKIWDFIIKNIIRNSQFYTALNSSNWQEFK